MTDDHIRPLDPMEHIRLRPGMYIGGVDTHALNHLAYGLLEYVIHQARQGSCTSVEVSILGPQTLQIRDSGEGIPLYKDENAVERDLETVMLYRHGSLFLIAQNYWIGGMGRGGALAPANAVSLHMHVEVRRDGAVWEQHYKQGRKTSEITRVRDLAGNEESGTAFTFTVDDEIFEDHPFDAAWIERQLFDVAHLVPGLKISFQNVMTGHCSTLCCPTGLTHYLAYMNSRQQLIRQSSYLDYRQHPPLSFHLMVQRELRAHPFEVDAALQFLRTPTPFTRSFANTFKTVEHGTHVDGCFDALRDSLLGHSSIITRHDLPSIFRHVTLIVSLWHPSPDFTFRGNGVRAVTNRDIYQRLYEEFSVALLLYFREYPDCIPQLEAMALENRQKRRYRAIRGVSK